MSEIDPEIAASGGNFSSTGGGGGMEGGNHLASPGAWVEAAHALTLACSCLALLLNSLLMLALLRGRVRERCSGMLVLTGTELVLNLLLVVYLLGQILFDPNKVPDELGQCAHAAQMTRNWWMLAVTAYRAVITARPELTAQPGRQFPARYQTCLLLAIVGLSASDYLVGSLWSLGAGGGSDWANATGGSSTLDDEAMRSLRMILFRHLKHASLGAILPGCCVLCLACRIARSLRARYSSHRATNRAARTILLLSVGFVALEFPYAVSNAATSGYLLRLLGQRPLMSEDFRIIELLEKLASWGMAVVPLNSCLNFFILLRYSRSFRQLLGMRPCRCRQRRGLRHLQLRAARYQRTLAWQNHRAVRMTARREMQQLRGPHKCETVAMVEQRDRR